MKKPEVKLYQNEPNLKVRKNILLTSFPYNNIKDLNSFGNSSRRKLVTKRHTSVLSKFNFTNQITKLTNEHYASIRGLAYLFFQIRLILGHVYVPQFYTRHLLKIKVHKHVLKLA